MTSVPVSWSPSVGGHHPDDRGVRPTGRGYDRYPSVDCTTGHGYDRYPSVDCTSGRVYDRHPSVD